MEHSRSRHSRRLGTPWSAGRASSAIRSERQELSTRRIFAVAVTCTLPLLGACADSDVSRLTSPANATRNVVATRPTDLDAVLRRYLAELGYTGRIASTLEARLGRRIDRQLADVGRMLWFDPITGLRGDKACAGCHSPTDGFGDTQSIAIGIEN